MLVQRVMGRCPPGRRAFIPTLAACLLLLPNVQVRPADDSVTPREREWYVYDDAAKYLQGEAVQEIRDTPGPLTSWAPPPPNGKPVLHPFLTAHTSVTNYESRLRRLLEESTCLADYLARLRKIGLRVEAHTPDQIWQVRSDDRLVAEITDVPSVLSDDEGLLADLPLCQRFLSITATTPDDWARLRPILARSEDLASFLRNLLAAGLRAERRFSPTDCELSYEAPVRFTSRSATDRLKVTTDGRCSQAWLFVTITPQARHSALDAYSYRRALTEQLQVPVADMRAAAEKLFAHFVRGDHIESARDLPPYLRPKEYCDRYHAVPRIDKKAYESLRSAERPLFRHPTGPTTWVAVTYDPAQRKTITVVEGGAPECVQATTQEGRLLD